MAIPQYPCFVHIPGKYRNRVEEDFFMEKLAFFIVGLDGENWGFSTRFIFKSNPGIFVVLVVSSTSGS